jgi:L-iditol 2-dehydrogenase
MLALRKLAAGERQVELVNIPEPAPNNGQVLIKVKRAGICGTDLHILHGRFPKVRPPVTLGHEFAGVVTAVGEGAPGWSPGDRVVVETEAIVCGRCPYCISGLTNLCSERLAYGYSVDGGFAGYAAVRHQALHRLPAHVTFPEGALAEPLAVAVHAVMECGGINAGELILVTGPGPIGLLALQVAKAAGAQVVISGTNEDATRLKTAAGLGVGLAVNVERRDLDEVISDFSRGAGVDAAIECSGTPAALLDCLKSVKKRGRIIQVGLSGSSLEMDLDRLTLKEVTLKGAFAHNHATWTKALALLAASQVNLKPLVSAEFSLEDWQEGFRLSAIGAGLKYLLCPSD